jgi:hypothetical protein
MVVMIVKLNRRANLRRAQRIYNHAKQVPGKRRRQISRTNGRRCGHQTRHGDGGDSEPSECSLQGFVPAQNSATTMLP